LDEIIINNITSSNNIYTYLLLLVRQLYNIKEDKKIMNKIKKLDSIIDLKYVIHKIKNDNMEYITKINYLDKLLGDDKFKSVDNLEYKEKNMINYDLLK